MRVELILPIAKLHFLGMPGKRPSGRFFLSTVVTIRKFIATIYKKMHARIAYVRKKQYLCGRM